jgi:hypothetical protein
MPKKIIIHEKKTKTLKKDFKLRIAFRKISAIVLLDQKKLRLFGFAVLNLEFVALKVLFYHISQVSLQ